VFAVLLLIVDSSRFCTTAQWQASISLKNLFPANRWKWFNTMRFSRRFYN